MKKHNIIKGALGILLAGALTACSSDYLDVEPETGMDSSVVSSSVKGAQLGIRGLCGAMYAQYGTYEGYYSFNGESQCMMIYGDVLSQDLFSWIWAGRTSTWALNWSAMTDRNAWLPVLGWSYNYTLVSMANNILVGIDGISENPEGRDFCKAQALTFRAHAYTRLLQIYAPRWEDSNNGEKLVLPLRLDLNTGDCPLSSMNTVLDQIYSDLNTAIDLYESSGERRTYKWEPNIDVARAVFARVAMLRHDYATAQKMAHDARQSYPLMSADDYKSGFALENSEYIWNNCASPDQIFYFAQGSWYACNGPYPCIWGHGPGAINIDLYRQIPESTGVNAYADLFLTPDKRTFTIQRIPEESFWDDEWVDPVNMNMNAKVIRMKNAIASANRLNKPSIGQDWPNANTPTSETESGTTIVVPLGAQYKFWGSDGYGTNCFPYIRGGEMMLTEAEAAYRNGDENTARSIVNEIWSNRVEGYSTTATGADLLANIKLARRLELWGEGHSWFDLKRWGDHMVRRAWKKGDVNSGNIPSLWAVDFGPEVSNGWRWIIPNGELQYNHAISLEQVLN